MIGEVGINRRFNSAAKFSEIKSSVAPQSRKANVSTRVDSCATVTGINRWLRWLSGRAHSDKLDLAVVFPAFPVFPVFPVFPEFVPVKGLLFFFGYSAALCPASPQYMQRFSWRRRSFSSSDNRGIGPDFGVLEDEVEGDLRGLDSSRDFSRG